MGIIQSNMKSGDFSSTFLKRQNIQIYLQLVFLKKTSLLNKILSDLNIKGL